jgi:peptidylprolyl isomerase
VVIEMRSDLAPVHVARVNELVRQGFYDGLTFHNVVAGFVAETGDPTGAGDGGSGKTLKAELSGEPLRRGVVGMIHALNAPDTADSQFFILLGPAPHLGGKYTVWGRVVHGMRFTDLLSRGSPPRDPDKTHSLCVAADVKD